MAFYKKINGEPDQFMVSIYEGPKVGVDPDIAGEITRAIILESTRLGDTGRVHVASLTIARNALALRVKLTEKQLENEAQSLGEIKAIFGGIAGSIYSRMRMGMKK